MKQPPHQILIKTDNNSFKRYSALYEMKISENAWKFQKRETDATFKIKIRIIKVYAY